MSAAACRHCRTPLPDDAVYCPNCGTPSPDGQVPFAFEPADVEGNEELFIKPDPEPALGWGPVVAALAALLIVTAIVISVDGTGRDVAAAPTPTPAPVPTPTASPAATRPPTPAAMEAPDATATAALRNDDQTELDPAPSNPTETKAGEPGIVFGDSFSALPGDLLQVAAGSPSDDYVEVLNSLARAYGLTGTVVFANGDEATRLEFASGQVTRIPLRGRRYSLGGRNGIVTAGSASMVAQRWDNPDAHVKLDANITLVSGEPWLDPNGWEIVRYFGDDGANGFMAPWVTPSPDDGPLGATTPPTKHGGGTATWPWAVELRTPHPHRWTWDQGDVLLPWDAVLAENQGHLLVRTCERPGRCHNLVVDGNEETVARVDESLAETTLDQGYLALSTQATVAAFSGVRLADLSGSGLINLEIIDLESGRRTTLPTIDLVEVRSQPFWLDDALLVLPLDGSAGAVDVIYDRNGIPRAELGWETSGESGDSLTYFGPSD